MLARLKTSATWQFLFMSLGTSWLWAPLLNHGLSSRTTLISQYEFPGQPYAWLFKLGDVMAAGLLILVALRYFNRTSKLAAWLILVIGLGFLADPLLSTSCHISAGVCHEYFSTGFVLHATETVITAAAVFLIAVVDYWKRKRLLSGAFILFQISYGLLFLSQLASAERFNTFSQYLYQVALVGWLAWYVRDNLFNDSHTPSPQRSTVRTAVAAWALINGVLAIIISLAHLQLLGSLNGLYFAHDGAWLAQHSIITGLVLLYLGRHLYRGERRARQIFIILMGIETIKYAVISPQPALLAFYFFSMLTLFVLRNEFDRGTEDLTWEIRLRDLGYLTLSIVAVTVVTLGLLYHTHELSDITRRSIDNFVDYSFRNKVVPHRHLNSALLAHSFTAFIITTLALILWILFRPAKAETVIIKKDRQRAMDLLRLYSESSEDYFKIWPADKQYFFGPNSFIAYRVSGPIAFVVADPIAPYSEERQVLVGQFMKYCRRKRWTACFLGVPENSKTIYESEGLSTLAIGASALIDIPHFMGTTAQDKWWRWKRNRALKAGLEHSISYPPHSPKLMTDLKRVSDSWLTRPGRKERGLALGYFDKEYINECDVHYLHQDGSVQAFTNILPDFRKRDVVTVDLLRSNADASDSMPFLFYKVLEHLNDKSQYRYFDLGFVPFAAAKDPAIKLIKALSTGRFSSKGLEQFKNKFDPVWQPSYVAYDGDIADLALIALNVESAMDVD